MLHRETADRQCGRIDDHVHLLLATAEHVHLPNARYSLELRFYEVLQKGEQCRDVTVEPIGLGRQQAKPSDRAGIGSDGLNDRLVGVVGILRNLLQPVRHLEQRRIDVGASLKRQRDLPKAVRARGLELGQSLEPL